VFEDEYLSSEEALEILATRGEDPITARRSGLIDAVSASLILQRYLNGRGW
jgi:RNase H-fold protein (predicted Holliday junction resolvase)